MQLRRLRSAISCLGSWFVAVPVLLLADPVPVPPADDPLAPYAGENVKEVDPSTLEGKVMAGYQGWVNCPGDGAGLG